jgi:hypothetical protein
MAAGTGHTVRSWPGPAREDTDGISENWTDRNGAGADDLPSA